MRRWPPMSRKVTTINRVAKNSLGCADKNVVGKSIQSLNLPDCHILECLDGNKFSNVKKALVNDSGRFQYFATGRPIRDADGRIIGAVEIAKDMQEVKKAFVGRSCYSGNLDPIAVLMNGTPDKVAQEAERIVRTCYDAGGYVFCTGEMNPRDVPAENMRAMIQAARRTSEQC